MFKFKITQQLGDGSFGTVFQAQRLSNKETVAIKKIKQKYTNWEACLALREVKSLQKLNKHVNIIRLIEIFRESNVLYFVFEYAEFNLFQRTRDQLSKPFSPSQVQKWSHELLVGLSFMHRNGFFHRDLKPENLLLVGDIIKIADMGLAREIRSNPPFTEYVSTRWYRAPEVLLRSVKYSSPVDIWAVALIIIEMFTLLPLFPGTSEIDEIFRVCQVLGTPDDWLAGRKLAISMGFSFPRCDKTKMSEIIPMACGDAQNLIASMLQWDPEQRLNANEAVSHTWFGNLNVDRVIETTSTGFRSSEIIGKGKVKEESSVENNSKLNARARRSSSIYRELKLERESKLERDWEGRSGFANKRVESHYKIFNEEPHKSNRISTYEVDKGVPKMKLPNISAAPQLKPSANHGRKSKSISYDWIDKVTNTSSTIILPPIDRPAFNLSFCALTAANDHHGAPFSKSASKLKNSMEKTLSPYSILKSIPRPLILSGLLSNNIPSPYQKTINATSSTSLKRRSGKL